METSQVNLNDSVAVIGSGAVEEFTVTNSADFFQILSSTLYTNQILAVVREVICNAWDAHIAANKTDIPVEITLNEDNELIISDSGLGIPKDQMASIYGTYGLSTKKTDAAQTGGFGLGSKSPFAYAEHFLVISQNQGESTTYSLSRSSSENQGKPTITTVMSMPTTESGLKVIIPVKQKDITQFREDIKQVVYNAGIKATINGENLTTFPFETLKENWVITDAKAWSKHTSPVYVKYGSVIYPVPCDPYYNMELDQVIRITHQLRMITDKEYFTSRRVPSILFLVPANSVSVTPSRESLSLQKNTLETLKKVFAAFHTSYKSNFTFEGKKAINHIIAEFKLDKSKKDLLLSNNIKDTIKDNSQLASNQINVRNSASSWYEYVLCALGSHFNNLPHNLLKYLEVARIKAMIGENTVNKPLAFSLIKLIRKRYIINFNSVTDDWVAKNNYRYLYSLLDHSKDVPKIIIYSYSSSKEKFIPTNSYLFFEKLPSLLFKKVIVANSKKAVESYLQKHNLKNQNHIALILGNKKKHTKDVISRLEEAAYQVTDITDYEVTSKKTAKNIKSLVDYTSLSNYLNFTIKNATIKIAPKAVLYVDKHIDVGYKTIYNMSSYSTRILNKLFGEHIAIVTTKREYSFYIKNGIPPLYSWLNGVLLNELKSNTNIQAALKKSANLLYFFEKDSKKSLNIHSTLEFIHKHTATAKLLKIHSDLSEYEENLIQLIFSMGNVSEVKEIKEYLSTIKVSKQAQTVYNSILNSIFTSAISFSELNRIVGRTSDNDERIAKMVYQLIK